MLSSKASRKFALDGDDAPELIRPMNQELEETGLTGCITPPEG